MRDLDVNIRPRKMIGQFLLTFQGQFTRFSNYAPDSYAEGILR